MRKIIFHIDVNSAYLSWTAVEELKNGGKVDLRQIPAIIGGDQKSRHGVVLAKSPSAKKYGIRTGEPVVNAFRKCPNLIMRAPDHKMYHEKSQRLMEYVARHVCSRVFCGLREKNQLRSLFRRLPHILLGHTHIFIHIRPRIHLHQACNYFFHLFVPSFHMLSCDFSAYTLVYYIAYSPKQLPKFAIFIPFAAFIF